MGWLEEQCPLTSTDDDGFGVKASKKIPDVDDDKVNGRFQPSNWPFGFGCPYGALQPTNVCKYPDIEFMGRNPCYLGTEALKHAQTAAFVSIVIVQWADLVICKTRMLSIYHQGMENRVMLAGLLSETLLCCFVAYAGFMHIAVKTRDIM